MRALQDIGWTAQMLEAALKTDVMVLEVWPNSPADQFGIEAGWHLLEIDRSPPDTWTCIQARSRGLQGIVFYDPLSQAVRALPAGNWPFGMRLIPRVNEGLKEDVRRGALDPLSFSKLWSLGDWRDTKELIEPLETSMASGLSKMFALRRGDPAKRAAKIAAQDAPQVHLMLALAYLANGDLSTCDFYLDAREEALGRQEMFRDLADNWALELFIDIIVLIDRGRREDAKALAGQMLASAPRNQGVIALYCKLMGADPLQYWPEMMKQPFPVPYALPQHDPFGQWPEGGTVHLQDTLAAMKPGQLHVIYALGPYRTNGPMQDEIRALLALHPYDPDRIATIHMVTAIDNPNSHWIDKNQIEDMARDLGVPIQILYDRGDSLSAQLDAYEAPSTYVLDHKGRVLSMEPLADEVGYWQALGVMKTLD